MDTATTYNGLRGTSLKSGCGLYIRTGINYIDRKDLDIKHYDDLNEFQCKFIEIINNKGANIILSVHYRHPKKTSDETYINKLQETFDKITQEHKIVTILGDFNYNLLKYTEDTHVKKFADTMFSNNLQPLINKPTRVVKNQKPSLIDNFFVNAIDKEITSGNITSKITDHMPNFMIMKTIDFDHKQIPKKVRKKIKDVEAYQNDIRDIDLTPVLHLEDVNQIYKYYHDQVLHIINQHSPYVTLSSEQLKWIKKPWINSQMQALIEEKNLMYRKYLNKGRSKFWYSRYRALVDITKHLLKDAKKKYFAEFFAKNMHNSKKVWNGIREIIHNKFSKETSKIYLDENGNIITDQKKVADKFNKFYTSIAKKLVAELGKPSTKYQDYLKNPNEHSIYLNETDPEEVAALIRKFDITKAGDIYGISPQLVKIGGDSFAHNLSLIFNKSLTSGVFPHLLKVAIVITIHKGDSKMVAANYRPISLLPIFGKLYEKIIFSRLISFIDKYKILFNRQYGFQKDKSTEYALIDIIENIMTSLDKKESPCCVFLDFAKAFDTVNHKILLGKLHHYGIRGTALSLIESYLTERQQRVQICDSISDIEYITHGVPQGSILGPLFFLLYINDIAESSKILKFFLFADDTAIYLSHKDPKTLESIMNDELVNVSKWLIANKLSLNVKKSNALLFRTKNESSAPILNLHINGSPIEEKQYAKYLGIIVDHKLTYEYHINHVNLKLIKGNAILSQVKHYIPEKTLVGTYNSFIQSHIDYGLNVWGHAPKTHLQAIERQQRKAIRNINFKPRRFEDTNSLFVKNRILPLSQCLTLNSAKVIWKAANSLLPDTVSNLFNQRPNATSFHLPYRRITTTQDCITYRGVQAWNKIPEDIRSSLSIQSFKNKFKESLLSTLS